MIKEANQHPDC